MPIKPLTPQRRFGAVVGAERAKQGLSQEELAHRSGLSTSFMSHVERGTKTVSIETIVKVARGLGTTSGELMVRAGI